jgi:branched-subunit amino acid transport protein
MAGAMSSFDIWIVIAISSVIMFLMRITGYLIPQKLLQGVRLNQIITLIPIVLLAALVAIQTGTSGDEITVDHRLAGVAVGAVTLYFKGSFILVLSLSGLTGALLYNFL